MTNCIATTQKDSKLSLGVEHLQHVIDRDRYTLAHCLEQIKHVLGAYAHLRDPGRGSYAWDDERYQQEFGLAMEAIRASIVPLERMARDKTNCTTNPEYVALARQAGAEQYHLFASALNH